MIQALLHETQSQGEIKETYTYKYISKTNINHKKKRKKWIKIGFNYSNCIHLQYQTQISSQTKNDIIFHTHKNPFGSDIKTPKNPFKALRRQAGIPYTVLYNKVLNVALGCGSVGDGTGSGGGVSILYVK